MVCQAWCRRRRRAATYTIRRIRTRDLEGSGVQVGASSLGSIAKSLIMRIWLYRQCRYTPIRAQHIKAFERSQVYFFFKMQPCSSRKIENFNLQLGYLFANARNMLMNAHALGDLFFECRASKVNNEGSRT